MVDGDIYILIERIPDGQMRKSIKIAFKLVLLTLKPAKCTKGSVPLYIKTAKQHVCCICSRYFYYDKITTMFRY